MYPNLDPVLFPTSEARVYHVVEDGPELVREPNDGSIAEFGLEFSLAEEDVLRTGSTGR
jgi:hypothetical protein